MKIDIKDVRNMTAFGDKITPTQANDFFFLLDNVQNAETILSEAVRLLGVCKPPAEKSGHVGQK